MSYPGAGTQKYSNQSEGARRAMRANRGEARENSPQPRRLFIHVGAAGGSSAEVFAEGIRFVRRTRSPCTGPAASFLSLFLPVKRN